MPSYSPSPGEYLSFALNSLTQAYKGLEEEEEEEEEEKEKEIKEQVKRLMFYTQSILLGENPFIQKKEEKEKEKEKANNVLKGLVEEVRALRKEVAPIKETYIERLKKDLPSSSLLPSLPLLPSTPSPSSRSSTPTRSKKKQL